MGLLDGKRVLITGGTGSLGQVLTRRLLSGEQGLPKEIVIFSRDESKQHYMRMQYLNRLGNISEGVHEKFIQLVTLRIGDIRDFSSVAATLQNIDIVFNAAALKHVPACEYFPHEAAQTNIEGAHNIVRAIQMFQLPVETVVGISTDKACKPVNVMGMSKAVQERIFVQANMECPKTRFVCVRYGNVLASRGSVIPLFHDQIRNGGPLTITTTEMSRFLLSLDAAVDLIFAAMHTAKPGETYIPRVPSARIIDIAKTLIGERNMDINIVGIRPSEKIHEILISEEEIHRTILRGKYLVIVPALSEIREDQDIVIALEKEYSSSDELMSMVELKNLLSENGLLKID